MRKIKIKKKPSKSNLKKFLEGGNIKSVNRGNANIEAEKGESVVVSGNDGLDEHYSIGGKKHSQGGTPLSLDTGSFIFSDNKKKLKIKDKNILEDFGITGSKGKTPSEIAKKFDINKYKKVLKDPNSDKLEKETAKKMINNYNMKLSKLALLQEGMKGFPNGIPQMAMPYVEAKGLGDYIGQLSQSLQQQNMQQSPQFKNGGSIPKYANGGPGDPEKKKTIDPKYKKNPIYDQSSDQFDWNNIKVGDVIKTKDGKWVTVKNIPKKYDYTQEDFKTVFNNDETVADNYAYLEAMFNDPEIKKEYAEKVRKALLNKDYYKSKYGNTSEMYDEDYINGLDEDQIIKHFLTGQKRNMSLQAHKIDPKDFNDVGSGFKKGLSEDKKAYYEKLGIKSLPEAFEYAGIPITEENIKGGDLGIQQATYWGYNDLLKEKDKYSPEMQQKLSNFDIPQYGESDEPLVATISPIDSKGKNLWGNTSAGQLSVVKGNNFEYEPIELEDEPIKPIEDPEYKQDTARDEWWAQDLGNMGNLFGQRMRLKKYLPNSAQIDLEDPEVVYYDPSRALAANAEQSNIAAQSVTAFAGPQSTHRLTGIQGKSFANAANTLSNYEDKNVAVANNYLQNVNQIHNKENLANAQRMNTLHDQTTIANQQYDNSRRQANRNLFEAWRQGLTNKKMTQAVNSMFDQYETIPSFGGGVYFKEGRPQDPSKGSSSSQTSTDYISAYRKLKEQNPDVPDQILKKQLDSQFSNTQQSFEDPELEKKKQYLKMISGILG
jgi:hypothetical protein